MADYTPMGGSPPTADARGLLDQILSEVEASSPSPSAAAPPPPSPPTGDLSALGGLLSNPALLSAIPTLLGNLAPLMSGDGNSGGGSSPRSDHGGAPSRPLPAVRGHADRHTALLCAVKPYLSPARQESAETVIRLCRVWDSLERAGISLPGLLSSLGASAPSNGR